MTTLTGVEGGEYINALVVTCQNPRNFFGHNLVDMLLKTIDRIPSGRNTK